MSSWKVVIEIFFFLFTLLMKSKIHVCKERNSELEMNKNEIVLMCFLDYLYISVIGLIAINFIPS